MAEDLIQFKEKYYILGSSAYSDDRVRVLKQGDTFAVFDRYGDFNPLGLGSQGLFHKGTRFVSRLELRIHGERPALLSSTVLNDNTLLAVDLANPDMVDDQGVSLRRGSLHIFRAKFLLNGVCYEQIRLTNYETRRVDTTLSLFINSDFADIFEVRGTPRKKHGVKEPPLIQEASVLFSYQGLDGMERQSILNWSASDALTLHDVVSGKEGADSVILWKVGLESQTSTILYLRYECHSGSNGMIPLSYDEAFRRAGEERRSLSAQDCKVTTTHSQFNEWLSRSYADIHMMTARLPEGLYPHAGVPWFATVFGRDGILTALSYLWINPELARGVLSYLAAHQAKTVDADKDAEPGKILHEARDGEMARLKEVPFGLYYGSVDATPLFIVLAGAYFERTGDLAFLQTLWPHIEAALAWIKTYGDADGDGFVEYARRSPSGLRNQGWKDSDDAIFHADGTLAEGPIALCEVQGYVYDALTKASVMAAALGHVAQSVSLSQEAKTLRSRFTKAFWCEEISMYALALDGEKRPCRVRSSNAGHCLFSGIAAEEHVRPMAEALLSSDFFSGWGIRTVATNASRFNPMSYHNGSVWPHDNALIAFGLARYGFKDLAVKILTGLFDAALFLELHRLPELFCGFRRRDSEGPTLYPVACSPQAWASASIFLLLQSVLGLCIRGEERKIYFDRPRMPEFLHEIHLKNLAIGEATFDLNLRLHKQDVSVDIDSRQGSLNLVVIK